MSTNSLQANTASSKGASQDQIIQGLNTLAKRSKSDNQNQLAILHGLRGGSSKAILTQWKRQLATTGLILIETQAYGGREHTYYPVKELLLTYYQQLEKFGLFTDSILQGFQALSPILGAEITPFSDYPSETPGTTPKNPEAFYRDLSFLLTQMSNVLPAAILINDFDLASKETKTALHYLLSDAFVINTDPGQSFQGCIILTIESHSPDHLDLEEKFENIRRSEFFDLKKADEQLVKEFLHSPSVVKRFLNSSLGNPEELEELVELLPEKIDDLFLRRYQNLPQEGQFLIHTMAILNRPCSPETLLRMSGLSRSDGSRTLQILIKRHLIDKRIAKGQLLLSLQHPDRANQISQLIDSQSKKALHRKIAETLVMIVGEPNSRDAEEIAEHFISSDVPEAGIPFILAAAEQLHMGFSYHKAEALLARCVPYLKEGQHQCVLERLISLNCSMSKHQRALGYLGKLRKITGKTLAIQIQIISVLMEMGRFDSALKAVSGTFETIDKNKDKNNQIPLIDRLTLINIKAEIQYGQGAYQKTRKTAQEGLQLISTTTNQRKLKRIELKLHTTLGKICCFEELYKEGRKHFLHNLKWSKQLGWKEEEVRALFNMGTIAHLTHNYAIAEKTFLKCLTFGKTTSNSMTKARCLMNLAVIYHEKCDYGNAVDFYQDSMTIFKQTENNFQYTVTAINLAELWLVLGNLSRAQKLIIGALKTTYRENMEYFLLKAKVVEARILLEQKHYRSASEHFLSILEEPNLRAPNFTRRIELLQAETLLSLKEFDQCRALLNQNSPTKETDPDSQELLAEERILLGRLAIATNDLDTAINYLQQADNYFRTSQHGEQRLDTLYFLHKIHDLKNEQGIGDKLLKKARKLSDQLLEKVPEREHKNYLETQRHKRIRRLKKKIELPSGRFCLQPIPQGEAYNSWRRKYNNVIGDDPKFIQVLRFTDRIAASDSTVLIQGESGTGKERIAEAIHSQSPRINEPFIRVNCAAFVESLLHSELFGHEKGAFTGALKSKIGRFERADKGTIFLDEIGDISPNTQIALLRVLQEKEIERVGGTSSIPVDVRILCATNKSLEELVKKGQFRLDLYYRLKGVVVDIPPLRERRSDIPKLVSHFANLHSSDKESITFLPEALQILMAYRWPGNIRELENFIGTLLLFVDQSEIGANVIREFSEFFTEGEMEMELPPLESIEPVLALPPATPCENPQEAIVTRVMENQVSLADLKKEIEVACIQRALEQTSGNVTQAANILQMKRPRLSQIINKTQTLIDTKETFLNRANQSVGAQK